MKSAECSQYVFLSVLSSLEKMQPSVSGFAVGKLLCSLIVMAAEEQQSSRVKENASCIERVVNTFPFIRGNRHCSERRFPARMVCF